MKTNLTSWYQSKNRILNQKKEMIPVRKTPSIHIGTSGWHYMHWKGPFYPEELSPENFLQYYMGQFQTVEVNNTFYRLPDKKALAWWRDTVPDGFIFSVKASRYITHMKKLKDPNATLPPFFERITVLEGKQGPILFQLPPQWHFNFERFQIFLKALPEGFQYAFEFRDTSWFNQQTEEALVNKGAAFCIYDLEGKQSPHITTADFVYVRLHGPHGAYKGQYDIQTLSGWAGAFSAWNKTGKEIYCYFDNDEAGYAAQNALQLSSMLKA